MSEVLKWMALGEMAQRSRIGGGAYVLLADFDAEHALRLEAEKRGDIAQRHLDRMIEHSDSLERQVGELREQLASEGRHFDAAWEGGSKLATANKALQAKLDTAMGLLHDLKRIGWHTPEVNAFLNTTSTGGKDHD